MVAVLDIGAGYSRDDIIQLAESYLSTASLMAYKEPGQSNHPATRGLEQTFNLRLNNLVGLGRGDGSGWFFVSEINCLDRKNAFIKQCCNDHDNKYHDVYSIDGCCSPRLNNCCPDSIGSSYSLNQRVVIKWEDDKIRLLPSFFVELLAVYLAMKGAFIFKIDIPSRRELEETYRRELSSARLEDMSLEKNCSRYKYGNIREPNR